jgi:SSS family solute:Na+ symporter
MAFLVPWCLGGYRRDQPERTPGVLAAFSAQFTWIDWLVVVGYLAFTTWLGTVMAGRQATIRDFFLGGRKLPWWAVSGSIIATEISALTFVSVPWVVFQPGGNLTYLQLGVFGSFLARILVGYLLVPAYYQREIYSPYDYMGHQLGGHVRSMTTGLFVLGGMLGQSARIYLTAEVVNVVLHDQLVQLTHVLGLDELAWAIIIISGVSVVWTLIGGMTTVIWTDVVLFLAFVLGALIALGAVLFSLDGGLAEMWRIGWAAKQSGFPALGLPLKESGIWGKFTFFDFSTSPTRDFTIWTAMIASTWGGLGAYGTDQLMAQRMFCCRGTREARWAIISSSFSQLVTITVALVGIGLYAYYQNHPLTGEALDLFKKNGDRIFPIFTVEVIPHGLKGIIIAAIFAAAISSVMGILTALSQTVQSAFYNPLRERLLQRRGVAVSPGDSLKAAADSSATAAEQRRSVRVSRLLVLFWGVVLSLLAYLCAGVREHYPSILQLGLAMAGYCGGALLAGFALGFLPLKIDGRGYVWAAPLSVLYIFAIVWHQRWSHVVCWSAAAALLVAWGWMWLRERAARVGERGLLVLPTAVRILVVALGIAGMLWLNYFGHFGEGPPDKPGHTTFKVLAWPWYVPIGSTVAFVWGYLLAGRRFIPKPV